MAIPVLFQWQCQIEALLKAKLGVISYLCAKFQENGTQHRTFQRIVSASDGWRGHLRAKLRLLDAEKGGRRFRHHAECAGGRLQAVRL